MHNGAYSELEDAVAHHASPLRSLLTYAPEKFIDQVEIRSTYNPANQIWVAAGIDDKKLPGESLETGNPRSR